MTHPTANPTSHATPSLAATSSPPAPYQRPDSAAISDGNLNSRFRAVRAFTERLCEPLTTEDYVIQSMDNVSPTKWHLAHTSWFFERFILQEHSWTDPAVGYQPYHGQYYYLFNSYYNTVGPMHCRANRGLLSRPTVDQVYDYRHYVDEQILALLERADDDLMTTLGPLVTLGLHHEQQHQELMVTDLKHVFSSNPLLPAYRVRHPGSEDQDAEDRSASRWRGRFSDPRPNESGVQSPQAGARYAEVHPAPARWVAFEGGLHEIGCDAQAAAFSFDNEMPRHRVYLEPFQLASRLTTNGEYLKFVEDGGYDKPELWLSAGWATIRQAGWRQPIYWYRGEGQAAGASGSDEASPDNNGGERGGSGGWMEYTLAGPRPVDPAEPVSHLSYFEADAFARWCGKRLPTEAEWEIAAATVPDDAIAAGNFADALRLHPASARADMGGDQADVHRWTAPGHGGRDGVSGKEGGLEQMFGDLWEWTASQYTPYPGYRPLPGALGEYNGKFMCNQFVLRGGSCATARSHFRRTYRNFFAPDARWQFTGLRLATDG